jgi:hypothetical protein
MSGKRTRHIPVLAVIFAFVTTAGIVFWAFSRSTEYAFDDAYITFRYADNLRQGIGLVYNPGEWVLGTTTPLFALILAGLGFIVPNLVVLGHWLGAIGWIMAAWGATALLWQEGRPRAALVAGLLLAFSPLFLVSLGMETILVVALMLWSAWAWLGGRKWLTIFLGAALILMRQDGALWLILLGLEVWRRERTIPWREAIGVAFLLLPWFAFAWWRYGSPLPNSASAKIGQNELMPVGDQSSFWVEFWHLGTAEMSPLVLAGFVVALLLGLWVIASRARQLGWLVAWTVLYLVVYAWLDVVNFTWYFVPPLATTMLIVALGIGHLLGDENVAGRPRHERGLGMSPGDRLFQISGAIILVALILAQAQYMNSLTSLQGFRPAYAPAGRWLAENAPADASVAAIEIGVIGYLSQRPIVDTMGLVSPDMTDHQVGWVETLVYALNAHRPGYAIVLPKTAWDQLIDKWWFIERYEPAVTFDDVTIYQRRADAIDEYEEDVLFEFVGGLTLDGVTFSGQELQPGNDLTAWLHIHALDEQPADLLFTAYLVDAQTYERHAFSTVVPFDGLYRSQRWQPDDELAVPIKIDVPEVLPASTYRLGVTIYDPKIDAGLPLQDRPDSPNPDVQVGWLRFGQPTSSSGEGSAEALLNIESVQVQWQEGIELSKISLPDQPFTPGGLLPVSLWWRPSQPVGRNLTVFVHLVDSEGNIIAQQDRLPLDGRWPTPAWRPDEVYHDTYEIVLPESLPVGAYGLRIGFYDTAGRLPLDDGGQEFWFLPGVVQVQD